MADFNYLTDKGVIVPDTSQTRDVVVADWRSAFGQDLDVSPETPQGVFITQDIEVRDAVARNNADIANQINPDIAGGIWLDALWALTNGQRRGATKSLLLGVELTGLPSTLVPAGSAAIVSNTSERFLTTSAVIIGAGGTALVDMRAENTGPIAAPISSLDQVASSVLGWETVNNPSAALLGRDVESDISSRRRRRNTLALQSVAMPEAIKSRIYALEDVRSLVFRENTTNTTQVIDGITIPPHSIWVVVDGGVNADIAMALLQTKTLGAGLTGSVVVPTVDPASGQTYQVKFDRPNEISIFVKVTVRASTLDVQSIIPQAIVDYATGEMEGELGLVVGQDASPFEFAGAVNQAEPRIFVTKVEVSDNGSTWSTASYAIALNEVARVSLGSVSVVIA